MKRRLKIVEINPSPGIRVNKDVDEETFIERDIVTGLVTNEEYIKKVTDSGLPVHFHSAPIRTIAKWCLDYYVQYKKAPLKNIESIYMENEKKLQDTLSEGIRDVLTTLSEGYEEQKEEVNAEYLYERTVRYLNEEAASEHQSNLQQALSVGDIEEYQKLCSEFKPVMNGKAKLEDFVMEAKDLSTLQPKRQALLLAPWLREGQITMIFGKAGIGKSILCMHIAYLLGIDKKEMADHQDIGRWQPKLTRGVLYVDGEMGATVLMRRFNSFTKWGKQKIPTKFFPLNEYQMETEDTFYLSERKNQLKILAWLKANKRYRVIILDSVTTLFGLENENDNAEWNRKINPFLRDLKALNIATIILHHTGKNEKLGWRGASAADNMLDFTFHIKEPESKDPDSDKAHFTVIPKKRRHDGFALHYFTLDYGEIFDG